jgi:putative FmdB family regulatory protein
MPVYDYVCSACGHRYEVFHGLNEAGPHQCPLCEGPVTRAFVPPTIHFKGSGWAKNDRRSSAASAKKKASSSAKAGESASGGSSSGESSSGGSSSGESSSGGSSSGESSSGGSSSGESSSASTGAGS